MRQCHYSKGGITVEDDKFLAFVEDVAKKEGKVFILDSGEGNEFFDEDNQLDVEDLSGWLIHEKQRNEFVEARKAGKAYELFDANYIFAKRIKNEDGLLAIDFEKY